MRFEFLKKNFLFVFLLLSSICIDASCPITTPWSTPVNLSNSGNITSNIFSASTNAGFMAVWADSSNNAHYSFSRDGLSWQSGLVSSAQGDVASTSDVFVGGNDSGFVVTWIDSSNNAWSSFSSNNGTNWTDAIQINPNSLSLDSHSDVFVAGGSSGFVATMIGADSNAYVSFSTGTAAWSSPVQVTNDGSVYNQNWNSQTTRGFVSAVIAGNSCMLTWINNLFPTYSAYFETINPFSTPIISPIVSVGFFESVPIVAELDGYFMAVSRANVNDGQTYFSTTTAPGYWATFAPFATNPRNPDAGPWVAANSVGFLSVWVVGDNQGSPGTPVWTFSQNNGFNWSPVCSILSTPSTTIGGPVGLTANSRGFVATWLDSNDSNAYATFFAGPLLPPTNARGCKSQNIFLSQTELFNKITWSAPTDGTQPTSYKIYRDANLTDLVATVPANGLLQYSDQNTKPNITYTYYIVSVSQSGDVSSAVQVKVTQNC